MVQRMVQPFFDSLRKAELPAHNKECKDEFRNWIKHSLQPMSTGEVNGATKEELEEKRQRHLESRHYEKTGIPFEEAFCLLTIPKQPEDYDGPERYCTRRTAEGRDDVCPLHIPNVDNLDELASMTHGIRALQENLVANFSEAEQAAYEAIMDEDDGWAAEYDITASGPRDTLHGLAVEIVRESRADQVLEDYRSEDRRDSSDDGLTKVKAVYGPEDVIGSEDTPNYILDERRKARRQIQDLKDDLGITRKHQEKMEVAEANAGIDEVAGEIDNSINREEKEFDPGEHVDLEEEDNE